MTAPRREAPAPASKPTLEPPEQNQPQNLDPVRAIRCFAEYRREALDSQRQAIQLRQAGGLGLGSLVNFDQFAAVVRLVLDELVTLVDWIESGSPVFVPPLTDEEKAQWRFARDKGAAVPEHILTQL